ncbi:YlbG family protein [Lactobacillus sp. ESL0684]|uniref:YlbG family protein n=1 Tax=unclassified Lactobacillus TaxID=2620435 RepID=UPI0023F6D80A|nr:MULTISPECIES: YlbG family protein [unclassified Lactobacillus]WEV40611.1 YlbG family protein [Lactobacillus sp. ESL0681]WEV42869.1 YlbG family protein [Lactobacillus sp. ESL0684]
MSINQDITGTPIQKRQGLIVYLNSAGNQYKLRYYGDIIYFSKKLCYCIMYVDYALAKQTVQTLNSLDFVEKVEFAQTQNVDLTSSHIEQQITDLAQAAEEKLLTKNTEHTEQYS